MQPTARPSNAPSSQPTNTPSNQPTSWPTEPNDIQGLNDSEIAGIVIACLIFAPCVIALCCYFACHDRNYSHIELTQINTPDTPTEI
jgi:hypothetical protein